MLRNFVFNKVFVIESLENNERKTGKELYNDILKWKPLQSGMVFTCEFIDLNCRNDFFDFFNKIQNDAYLGLKPIFHFEIHGLKDKSGLSLKNGEIIHYKELAIALSTVNQIIGNNLFLTLSVCHGAYLLGNVQIDKPAPFIGFVGSFDLIYNSDSLMRYTEFYDAFLMSFDLGKAIQRFLNANTLNPNTFNLIDTEETFKSVYKKYLLENTTKDGIKKRWTNSIISENLKFNSRQHTRLLVR